MIATIIRMLALCCATLFASVALAQDAGLVEKKVFSMPSYTTVGGKTIRGVKVGYETWGRLNARGDNAVFVAHFFSGTSHAAGRYKPDDRAPGYWDAIIGPGKAIDTDKWFVISADTLANLNVKDPYVVTTGPASVNPDTGSRYGSTFPVITMGDSVRVHRALVDSLGVKKLAAVAGASGGSIQAMEWAAFYPDLVERVIHVIGPGLDIHPYVIGLLDAWMLPIRTDPRWNNGDFYGRAEPTEGVANALKLVTLTALHHGWAEKVHGYKWAAPDRNPAEGIGNLFSIEDALYKTGLARAATTDANHFVWMAKANQLFDVSKDMPRMRAKFLFVPAKSDLVFPPELSRGWAEKLRKQGNVVEIFEIEGRGGHLDGIFQIGQAADAIRAFMAK